MAERFLRARVAGIAALAAACACCALLPCQPIFAADNTDTLKPLYWRQNLFAIPFRVHTPPGEDTASPSEQTESNTGPELREVQLFASRDGGRSWHMVQRVSPQLGSFTFRAEQDGEYWFSMRSLTADGQLLPAGNHQPGIIVVVDTVAPELAIEGKRGSAGEIQLTWQATDPRLQPESLKVEYRLDSGADWQALAVGRGEYRRDQGMYSGQANWWPGNIQGTVTLRAEITDLAGNRSVTQTQIDLGSTQAPSPPAEQTPFGAQTAARQQTAPSAGEQQPGKFRPASTGGNPFPLPGGNYQMPDDSLPQGWPADRKTGHPYTAHLDSTQVQTDPPTQPAGTAAQAGTAGEAANGEALPTTQFVRQSRFALEYDVLSADQQSVGAVELWATRDGGRSWRRQSIDQDRQSPIPAALPEDGLYGLRIVIARPGEATDVPPGEAPQMWVVLDSVPPEVRLKEVARQAGSLLVQWEASDANPAPRPVTLSWSESPQGPWQPLAESIADSGQWILDNADRLPDRCHIRLQVRDKAGNIASVTAEAATPPAAAAPAPKSRIRGLRPVDDAESGRDQSAARNRPWYR